MSWLQVSMSITICAIGVIGSLFVSRSWRSRASVRNRRFPNPALLRNNPEPRAKVKAENFCIILAKGVCLCRISDIWTARYVD